MLERFCHKLSHTLFVNTTRVVSARRCTTAARNSGVKVAAKDSRKEGKGFYIFISFLNERFLVR